MGYCYTYYTYIVSHINDKLIFDGSALVGVGEIFQFFGGIPFNMHLVNIVCSDSEQTILTRVCITTSRVHF